VASEDGDVQNSAAASHDVDEGVDESANEPDLTGKNPHE
jgi:hypothetical protein